MAFNKGDFSRCGEVKFEENTYNTKILDITDYRSKYVSEANNFTNIDTLFDHVNERIKQETYWYYKDGCVYVPMSIDLITGIYKVDVFRRIEDGKIFVEQLNDYQVNDYQVKKRMNLKDYHEKYCTKVDDKWIYDSKKVEKSKKWKIFSFL